LQSGFTELAKEIGAKAYDKAAEVVASLRDGFACWHTPGWVGSIEKCGITLPTVAMCQLGGVDPLLCFNLGLSR
jgi:hypothetical protein